MNIDDWERAAVIEGSGKLGKTGGLDQGTVEAVTQSLATGCTGQPVHPACPSPKLRQESQTGL